MQAKRFFTMYIFVLIPLSALLFALDNLFPLPTPKEYSKVVLASDSTLLNAYLTQDDKWRMRTRLDEISPEMNIAIIEKEDKWFYRHFGVNPLSVLRALLANISSGRRVSGASTITMQLARMLEPAERTYLNKFLEMLRAIQLELHYSKEEILEMYLSILPYGSNIEGVKAASFLYFDKAPDKLSLAQSVLLTIIPNNPVGLRPDVYTEKATKIRNSWLRQFGKDGVFSAGEIRDAIDEPLQALRREIEPAAPHLCRRVAAAYGADLLYTTLDLKIQQRMEKLLKSHVRSLAYMEVTNGAVIVIDNRTMNVAGYCGSADFYDTLNSGQVDGLAAVRSPGSTLKPGLFAAAFDAGMLTPKMRMLDIPMETHGYTPENYTLRFHGDVTAAQALRHSLNIPAVRLLKQFGVGEYIRILEKAGLESIPQNRKDLGLSLILGGCGVRADKLAHFFTCFANGGKMKPLNFLKSENPGSPMKIFSPGAAFLIADILSSIERPDFPNELLMHTNLPKIAWKTGTSYGKRDAWAVGFNPEYTVCVWIGNFDGRGSPALSGAEAAVPLLIKVFNAIPTSGGQKWFDRPESVMRRQVCAETGLLPSEHCTELTEDYYIENVSPRKVCGLFREIYVDSAETVQYCPSCLPTGGYKKKFYPVYPPELEHWLAMNGELTEKPPPHNPDCITRFSGEGPRILSPSPSYEYFIEGGSGQKILLQAASDVRVKEHFWYVNGKFLKKCKAGGKVFHIPEEGTQKISCIDDKGRKSSVIIEVSRY